jgi:hypothetical protein
MAVYNELFRSKIEHLYFCVYPPTAKVEDIAGELARCKEKNKFKTLT